MTDEPTTCRNAPCPNELRQPGTGRKRAFCSNRCKVAYYRQKQLRETIEAQRQLGYICLNRSQQWLALDQNTTRVTLTRLAQDYGTEAVLLAMQAIDQEIKAREKGLSRIQEERSGKQKESGVEIIIGEAKPLE